MTRPSVWSIGSFACPRVILLVTYDRVPKRQVRFSRYNIYARDKLHLPVLRPAAAAPGTQSRPRHPPLPGRHLHLGERGLLLPRVQSPQGRPHTASSRHAPSAQAGQARSGRRSCRKPSACRAIRNGCPFSIPSTFRTGTPSSWKVRRPSTAAGSTYPQDSYRRTLLQNA